MSNSYQGQPLVPIPEGFGLPFYYSSLFNIGVFYLADLKVAPSYLSGTTPDNFQTFRASHKKSS